MTRIVLAAFVLLAPAIVSAQDEPTGRARAQEMLTSKAKAEKVLADTAADPATRNEGQLRADNVKLRAELEKLLRVVDRKASLCARVAGERP